MSDKPKGTPKSFWQLFQISEMTAILMVLAALIFAVGVVAYFSMSDPKPIFDQCMMFFDDKDRCLQFATMLIAR